MILEVSLNDIAIDKLKKQMKSNKVSLYDIKSWTSWWLIKDVFGSDFNFKWFVPTDIKIEFSIES